ncbi:hypothetical protein ACP3VS_04515 [Lysinibacillus sp. VIII_CA]
MAENRWNSFLKRIAEAMKPMEIKKPTEKDEDTMKFTNLTTKT